MARYTLEKCLLATSLFHLSNHVHSISGGMIACFIATFVFYWWHRWRHKIDYLWTHFYQIHHSPQCLDFIAAFYKHPLEMTAKSIVGSLLVYTFLGLDIETGVIYILCTDLEEFFCHTNEKIAQLVGCIFQRPEMHLFIMNTKSTPTIMEILLGETRCLEHTKTQKSLTAPVVLMPKKNLD